MANVLDAAQIQALLARTKARGEYDEEVVEFLKSGEAGIEVSLKDGRLQGKNMQNVVVGLNNARTRQNKETGALVHDGGQNIKVVGLKDDDGDEHVYMINTAVGQEEAEAA